MTRKPTKIALKVTMMASETGSDFNEPVNNDPSAPYKNAMNGPIKTGHTAQMTGITTFVIVLECPHMCCILRRKYLRSPCVPYVYGGG